MIRRKLFARAHDFYTMILNTAISENVTLAKLNVIVSFYDIETLVLIFNYSLSIT